MNDLLDRFNPPTMIDTVYVVYHAVGMLCVALACIVVMSILIDKVMK